MTTVKPSRRLRTLLALAILPLPFRVKRLVLVGLLGAVMDKSARIGLSLIDCEQLVMGEGSRIGHLNVLRGMRQVRIGPGATVENLNWITASSMFLDRPDPMLEKASFLLGRESAVTSRHYIDCSGGVRIGQFTIVGGVRSTILSHQIDLSHGVQTSARTEIGDYCFVSSNVCVAPGSRIPNRSVIAMGGVVVGELSTPGALYGGVPARVLRRSVDGGRYFHRKRGFVGRTPSPHLPVSDGPEGELVGP